MTISPIVAQTIDLHMHTTASDGELPPCDLVEAAVHAGLQYIAITDHDTTASLSLAREHAKTFGLTCISGVEISSRWNAMDVHVVGLGIKDDCERLQERLESQKQRRDERAIVIGQRLEKLGIPAMFEKASQLASHNTPGRPHFAEALVAQGACRDKKQAFQRFLAIGKPAYVKVDWPDLLEAVRWIREAGGVAVLAHPGRYKLTRSKLTRLVKDFEQSGGQGIEVSVSTHSPEMVQHLADLSLKFGLYASQGSDYHGPSMRWVKLGRMPPLPSRCSSIFSTINIPVS